MNTTFFGGFFVNKHNYFCYFMDNFYDNIVFLKIVECFTSKLRRSCLSTVEVNAHVNLKIANGGRCYCSYRINYL